MNGLLSGLGLGAVVAGGMTIAVLTVMPEVNVGPDPREATPSAAAGRDGVAASSDPVGGDDGLFAPRQPATATASGDTVTPPSTKAPGALTQGDDTPVLSPDPEPQDTVPASDPLEPTRPTAFELAALNPLQAPRDPDAPSAVSLDLWAADGLPNRLTVPNRPTAPKDPIGSATAALASGPVRDDTERQPRLDPEVPEAFELAALIPSRARSNPGAPSAISRGVDTTQAVPRRPEAPARSTGSAAPGLAQSAVRGDTGASVLSTETGSTIETQSDAVSLGSDSEPAEVEVMTALGAMPVASGGGLGPVRSAASFAAMRPTVANESPSTLRDAAAVQPPATRMSAPLRPSRVAVRTRLEVLNAPVFAKRGATRLPEGLSDGPFAALDEPAAPRFRSDGPASDALQGLNSPDGLTVLALLTRAEAPKLSTRSYPLGIKGNAPRAVSEPRRPDAPDPVGDTPDSIDAPPRNAEPAATEEGRRSIAAPPRVRPSLPQVGVERETAAPPDPVTTAEPPADALSRNAVPFEEARPLPRLAIVLLDDPAAPILDEPRLSVAIAADSPDAAARAQAWRVAGQEIVLIPSLPDGTAQDIAQSLQGSLIAVPTAASVMPGQDGGFVGGNATAQDVISRISDTGHGLLTWPDGLDGTARRADRAGVPNRPIGRRVDEGGRDARTIARFLDGAAFDANRRGENIVLAANSEATRTALAVWINASRAQTVTLVPVSALLLAE